MSHGGKAEEPNMVPLLDLVLQLVMFFMVCANFVMEQVNQEIKLPEAASAKPLDKSGDEPIFLNVNDKGEVLLSQLDKVGEEGGTLANPEQVRTYMTRRYNTDMKGVSDADRDKGPKRRVVIRADKYAKFKDVYAIMTACRKAGYFNAEMRVLKP